MEEGVGEGAEEACDEASEGGYDDGKVFFLLCRGYLFFYDFYGAEVLLETGHEPVVGGEAGIEVVKDGFEVVFVHNCIVFKRGGSAKLREVG